MNSINFAALAGAVEAEWKTCTRRNWEPDYAAQFKAGMLVQAHSDRPHLRGSRFGTVRLLADAELSDVYPTMDYHREGFTWARLNPHHDPRPPDCEKMWWKWIATRPALWVVRFRLVELIDEDGQTRPTPTDQRSDP